MRPIDGEEYMKLLKEQYLHHKAMGNNQISKAWQGAMQLLYDMPTLTPQNEPLTCEGCAELGKWENEYEYGFPSPCTHCKRRACDNYHRQPERQEDTDA